MNKLLEDKEIIDKVLYALHTNSYQMAQKLEYKSHASISNVLYGNNPLSKQLADKIVKCYPNVSYRFLLTGEGNPLNPEGTQQNTEIIPTYQDPLHIIATLATRIENIEKKQDSIKENMKLILEILQKKESGQ